MARNIFQEYVASKTTPVTVRNAIIDRTTTSGMTPTAIRYLDAAVQAAAQAGLARIDIVAGRGGGHKSHRAGTEWDIRGYNPDGSLWSNAQRVAVAEGARRTGADRFGIYRMDRGIGKGTLHIGYSGPGRPPAVWGANGLTSGVASRRFSDPDEIAFNKAYNTGQPFSIAAAEGRGRGETPDAAAERQSLASRAFSGQPITVLPNATMAELASAGIGPGAAPQMRAPAPTSSARRSAPASVDDLTGYADYRPRQLATVEALEPSMVPRGPYGAHEIINAAASGDPRRLAAALDTVGESIVSRHGILRASEAMPVLEQYFQSAARTAPGAVRVAQTAFARNPAMRTAVPAQLRPEIDRAFAALPPRETTRVPLPPTRPAVRPVEVASLSSSVPVAETRRSIPPPPRQGFYDPEAEIRSQVAMAPRLPAATPSAATAPRLSPALGARAAAGGWSSPASLTAAMALPDPARQPISNEIAASFYGSPKPAAPKADGLKYLSSLLGEGPEADVLWGGLPDLGAMEEAPAMAFAPEGGAPRARRAPEAAIAPPMPPPKPQPSRAEQIATLLTGGRSQPVAVSQARNLPSGVSGHTTVDLGGGLKIVSYTMNGRDVSYMTQPGGGPPLMIAGGSSSSATYQQPSVRTSTATASRAATSSGRFTPSATLLSFQSQAPGYTY